MKITSILAFTLVIVGALVWLLVGIFDFNLVAFIFGSGATAVVSRIIYSLVGISALWLLFVWAMYHPFKVVE
ncbi:MAG: DUF378 domain-containing protein [Clostridiales bacterium]|nr:DUF378 domain-containing protein [Clostridiales bacterium]